jgi:hypothetical protein
MVADIIVNLRWCEIVHHYHVIRTNRRLLARAKSVQDKVATPRNRLDALYQAFHQNLVAAV